MPSERLNRWLVIAPPLVFLLLFFVAPALIMIDASFRYPGEYGGLAPQGHTVETYQFFFSAWIYPFIFVKSLGVAALSTALCILFAYPLALWITRLPKAWRDILILLVVLPFASNFLIRIYAWMIILGPQNALSVALNQLLAFFGVGPVRLLFSPFAVIVGMVYVHLPFMILPLYTNLERHDPAWLDAAQDLGANAWQRFWQVTWPLSLPGITAGAALVFIPVLGMFAIPDILGGTGDILIGNLIKEQFLGTRDWPFGATLSLLLTVMVLAVAGIALRFSRGRRYA